MTSPVDITLRYPHFETLFWDQHLIEITPFTQPLGLIYVRSDSTSGKYSLVSSRQSFLNRCIGVKDDVSK